MKSPDLCVAVFKAYFPLRSRGHGTPSLSNYQFQMSSRRHLPAYLISNLSSTATSLLPRTLHFVPSAYLSPSRNPLLNNSLKPVLSIRFIVPYPPHSMEILPGREIPASIFGRRPQAEKHVGRLTTKLAGQIRWLDLLCRCRCLVDASLPTTECPSMHLMGIEHSIDNDSGKQGLAAA